MTVEQSHFEQFTPTQSNLFKIVNKQFKNCKKLFKLVLNATQILKEFFKQIFKQFYFNYYLF